MKKLILLLFFIPLSSFAQEPLSLEECYNLAETNYPKAKQSALVKEQSDLNSEIIKTHKYPKIDFDAQATYQSDVIHFPTENPGLLFELPNKDQYRATLTLNQLIYGGGTIDAAIAEENAKSFTQLQKVNVELYQLKPKINQIYFSILLSQEKKEILLAKQKQVEEKLKEIKAGIKYGAVLPTSDAILEAELLKIKQQLTDIESTRQNLIQTLEKYIGSPISNSSSFTYPENTIDTSKSLNRPEMELFNLQKYQIENTSSLLQKNRLPKIYGFAQGGYGNPGLNMLDNSFQAFYYVGLKLNWNVFDWNKTKKQTQALELNKQIIESEKEEFKLQTNIQLEQQALEVNKYNEFINSDQTIISLQKHILKTAESQLKNGVITSSDYMDQLTDLYEAEINLKTHQIQLLLAQANYKVIQGN
ncbi:MAG: TolC family protein [Flavobacteriaceae bacterium]|nr:TolC family protein [Flavobacteriaceae bacterium]